MVINFLFFDNFYNAFFHRKDWYVMMALDFLSKFVSALRISKFIFCIFLRLLMNLMIHLPLFVCIYNYFCFAGIVVETNCTLPLWKKCLSSFCASVCTTRTISSRASAIGHWSRAQSTGIDELYSCEEFFA